MKIDSNTFAKTELNCLKQNGIRFEHFITKDGCPFDKVYVRNRGLKFCMEEEEILMRFFFWLKLLTVD